MAVACLEELMSNILDTGIRNTRNVLRYAYGENTLSLLPELLDDARSGANDYVLYFVDEYFRDNTGIVSHLPVSGRDHLIYVPTEEEPTTAYINSVCEQLRADDRDGPCAVIGMGGGITMDTAKAVSNLLTNGGRAEDYQGWDLVRVPGVYKIAIPTLSGTGAEATRTCVMTNKSNGLKLGMNSDFTVYDQLILDPELTRTVPRNQYFYTGMDAYIHCIEALAGSYRNAIGDAYSDQSIRLCREVFDSQDMMSDEGRAKMMVASYLGGCAIATSYVGVVHPFSAGLSVVLGLHHCVANCITMRAMEEFYPREYDEFWRMVDKQGVEIPEGVCRDLSDEQYQALYDSTVVHEKPLTNALGEGFRELLTEDKVRDIFSKM